LTPKSTSFFFLSFFLLFLPSFFSCWVILSRLSGVYLSLMQWVLAARRTRKKGSTSLLTSKQDSLGTSSIKDTLQPLQPEPAFTPKLNTTSLLLNEEVVKNLYKELPIRMHFKNWELVYSTRTHGISLNTFYRNAGDWSDCILLVKDKNQNVSMKGNFEWEASFYFNYFTFLFLFQGIWSSNYFSLEDWSWVLW
jgi:hypothetical protein